MDDLLRYLTGKRDEAIRDGSAVCERLSAADLTRIVAALTEGDRLRGLVRRAVGHIRASEYPSDQMAADDILIESEGRA